MRRHPVVDLGAQLVGGDGAELLIGRLDAQIERAAVPGVDDRTARHAVRRAATGADQQARHLVDRLLRRREADALQPPAGEGVEPLERQRQVRAALVGGNGVDLVDDHRAGVAQHVAAAPAVSRM